MLVMLLVDGRPFGLEALAMLLGVIAIVSCVANYGYAINELFDQEEDRRGGRSNATEVIGARRMRAIIVFSAIAALLLATALGGFSAVVLTGAVLALPLAYSVPPIRLKERGWLGILADALAAHVFPAVLAILVGCFQNVRAFDPALLYPALAWSLATGLRGIISHQLQSAEHDRNSELETIVHRYGHAKLRLVVVYLILPTEILSFFALASKCDVGNVFAVAMAAFLIYELLKTSFNVFPVTVFQKQGERYIPFVDEGLYKVWGPLALILDAAVADPLFLILIVPFLYAFRARNRIEWRQIVTTMRRLRSDLPSRWLQRK